MGSQSSLCCEHISTVLLQTGGCHAGVASDAVKVAEYRSALRLRSSMLQAGFWGGLQDEAAYKNFSRILSKARTASLRLLSAGPVTFSHYIMHVLALCSWMQLVHSILTTCKVL